MFRKILVLALLLFAVFTPSSTNAQQRRTAPYDTIWIQITPAQIQAGVRANSNNSIGLYQLSRRATYQGSGLIFFKALERLIKEQPKNATLVAMQRSAIERSIIYSDTSVTKQLNQDEYRSDIRRTRLEAAKKLVPSVWLNYITEGNLLIWENRNPGDLKIIKEQIRVTQRAINLSPKNPFPYKQMGACLTSLLRKNGGSDAEAVRYYHKAEQLAPANCSGSLALVYHYTYTKPNAAERQKAIQAVYATIPPKVKLTPPLRKVLLDTGIPIPKGH